MKIISFATVVIFFTCFSAKTQTLEKAASNAFLVTRMVAKFHVQPKPIDKIFSAALFKTVIHQLDEDRIYFTQADIKQLQNWENLLDEQVLKSQTNFLKNLLSIYTQRVLQTDTLIENICKQNFVFNANEVYAVAEDTSFAIDATARRNKLYKKLKLEVLDELIDYDSLHLFSPKYIKKFDSIEIAARQKIKTFFKRSITRQQNYSGGLTALVGNEYCNAIAKYFDPHTAFFPPVEKEKLQAELGEKPMQFGFGLSEDNNGTAIDKLVPGSPAYKSGQLNKGDKIEALQWEGKENINVSDAPPREISEILSASNHDKLTITVKKADGSLRKVTLQKEKATQDDELGKVKSFILKGEKQIGFISFPAFYTDWENTARNVNGCANDIAKEIIKLKKENIQGLIIDLRFNGGGSMQEAVELSGLFIDAGPVGQVKTRDEKVYTLKDVNRGTIYDGPLALMTNSYSASASEMLAGTLQDYNRAVIVGTPTFGKATAQVVLPLDTSINLEEDNEAKQAENYIKLTISKLFRINGTAAQEKGVLPDISLSSFFQKPIESEAEEPFVIPASLIDANKYYKPYQPLPIKDLQQYAKSITDTAAYFVNEKKYLVESEKEHATGYVTLNLKEAYKKYKVDEKKDSAYTFKFVNHTFSVSNHLYEIERMKADEDLQTNNAVWKKILLADPYVDLTYRLLTRMAK